MTRFLVRNGCGTGRWIQEVVVLSGWLAATAAFANEPAYSTTSERLVAEARQAEMKGDAAQQFSLLREAVRAEPDNESARWQLGEIKVGDEWMAVEDSQRKAAADPVQAEYRAIRRQFNDKPAGQLALRAGAAITGWRTRPVFIGRASWPSSRTIAKRFEGSNRAGRTAS